MTSTIEATVEELCRGWTRIGGCFTVPAAKEPTLPEELLARTARYAEYDYRLFFVAATWFGTHAGLLDEHRLGQYLDNLAGKSSAVAGALCDVAKKIDGPPVDRLEALASHCVPLDAPTVLFRGTERNPAFLEEARKHALPEFARWGLLHGEVSLKRGAIRPLRWIRAHCPELREREPAPVTE